MPVPTIIAEDEIKTLDPDIFARLDGYTAPRHVNDAGCTYPYDASASSSDDTGSVSDDGGGGVDVEAEYLIGEYYIVILSAEESGELFTWLNEKGYYMAEGAEERLQEYIDAGSYFLAAKVSGDAAVASGEPLSPLQVSYESEIFSIPIRLATMNSPGEQDMVIYALTDKSGTKDAGQVGLANYAEFDVPNKCIWGEAATEDFSEFYEETFTEAWEAVGEGAWTMEYAGTWNDCSPCSGVSITPKDLIDLGFHRSIGDSAHHLTRLRMRYTPEQAIEDLVLYGSGIYEPKVTSFADDDYWLNAECIEYCDPADAPEDGGTDDGAGDSGTGDSGSGDAGADTATPGGDSGGTDDGSSEGTEPTEGGDEGDDVVLADDESGNKSGCSTSGAPGSGGLLVLMLGLVGLAVRRR